MQCGPKSCKSDQTIRDEIGTRLVEAAARWLEQEHRAPEILFGHSLGGTATMLGAAARPDLIEELALVEAVIPIRSREQADPARIARLKRLVAGAKSRRAHWPSRSEARDQLKTMSIGIIFQD